jgi:hypothetical protein
LEREIAQELLRKLKMPPLAVFPPSIYAKCCCHNSHTDAFVAMAPVLCVHFLILRLGLFPHLPQFRLHAIGGERRKCTECAYGPGHWVARYEKSKAVVAIALWEGEVVLHCKAYDRIPIIFCFQKTEHFNFDLKNLDIC